MTDEPLMMRVPVKDALDGLGDRMDKRFDELAVERKEDRKRIESLERSRAWGRGVSAVLGSGLLGALWGQFGRQ